MKYFADDRVGVLTLRDPVEYSHRLIWFPFGGGNSHSFSRAAAAFPPTWQIFAVDGPEHLRTRGPAVTNLQDLAMLYLESLSLAFFQDAILVGHSVGALIAAKLGRELERRSCRATALVLCASPPPSHIDSVQKLSQPSFSEEFEWWKETMFHDEGVSDDFALELFEVVYPAMKSDLKVFESAKTLDLRCWRTPTLVLAGADDQACSLTASEAWKSYTANVDFLLVPGGHLFVLQYPDATAQLVVEYIRTRALSGSNPTCH